jgi:hypothetical protein
MWWSKSNDPHLFAFVRLRTHEKGGLVSERGWEQLGWCQQRTVSHPSVPCWPSLSETQFLMPAASTACSRCCDSNARFDLRNARAHMKGVRALEHGKVVCGALEDEDKLARREDRDGAQR